VPLGKRANPSQADSPPAHRVGLPIHVRFSTSRKPSILLLLLSVVLCLPLMASGPHFQADEHTEVLHNTGYLFSSANAYI